ncbi:hypothetical protein DEM27_15450 [Metarhizobium album]|uniref:Toxin-antitoxin system HicB family antitoxin n=2 Tax=Metarhizobium album TaxID=2182425 RepID=A0A2U2DQK8_9HYPH|nr:hypothetical protein DEM27_15450 [Rhizobium album]
MADDRSVNLMLRGGRVTEGFRENLFDAANREGRSVNEFVLRSAAEKLLRSGRPISGVFDSGDVDDLLREIQL